MKSLAVFVLAGLMSWGIAPREALAQPSGVPPSQPLTAGEVVTSLTKGRSALMAAQLSDGSYPADGYLTHAWQTTCLATQALLQTGTPADSPVIQKSLTYLEDHFARQTRSVPELAYYFLTLHATGSPQIRPRLAELAESIQRLQLSDGGWPYNAGDRQNAPTCLRLAISTLHVAAELDLEIPKEVWIRAREACLQDQLADGSWEEVPPGEDAVENRRSALMATQEALWCVSTCDRALRRCQPVDCCQSFPVGDRTEKGLRWLEQQLAGRDVIATRENFLIFSHYGLSQAQAAQRIWSVEERRWYEHGARLLLYRQRRTGLWAGNNTIVATSYALLYLAPGLDAIALAKIRPSSERGVSRFRGNGERDDVRNLAGFLSRQAGWPSQIAGQVVDVSTASSLSQVQRIPVVWLTGSDSYSLSPTEQTHLKSYLENGGTLLVSPECGSRRFEGRFRDMLASIAPSGSGELEPLSPSHPVFFSEFPLSEETVIWGVETGCRTAIFFVPQDLRCDWDRARHPQSSESEREDVRNSLHLGANVIAYASGRRLPRRLDDPLAPQLPASRSVLRHGWVIGQIRHNEGAGAAWHAAKHVAEAMTQEEGVSFTAIDAVDLRSTRLYEVPLLLMHGHRDFCWSPEERGALRRHLQQGGLLLVDACCGSMAFDAAFRREIRSVFPDAPLKPLPFEEMVLSADDAAAPRQFRRRRFAAHESGSQTWETEWGLPELEGVKLDGRIVVVYSRDDLSCAIHQLRDPSCEGYLVEDAFELVIQILGTLIRQDVSLPK